MCVGCLVTGIPATTALTHVKQISKKIMKIKNGLLEIMRCPHCNIFQPNMESKWTSSAYFAEDYNTMVMWEIYECTNCFSPTAIKLASMNGTYEIIEYFPKVQSLHLSIPESSSHFLIQAMESVNTPEASVLLSCSAIDAMFKALGYKEGSLYSRII